MGGKGAISEILVIKKDPSNQAEVGKSGSYSELISPYSCSHLSDQTKVHPEYRTGQK